MIRIHSRTAAAIAVFSLALLAGCGKSGPSAPTGVYQSKMGPDQTMSFNFLPNNEIEASFSEGGRTKSYKTSYVTSGDDIIINVPESERQSDGPAALTLKRNGEALELTMQGMTIRYEKL
jgi:hypothetical protein